MPKNGLVAVLSADKRAVKTYSLGFEGDPKSELAYAAAVAKHFGTTHHKIHIGDDRLLLFNAFLDQARARARSRA